MRTTAGLVGLVALSFVPVYGYAQGFLENPQPDSAQSGISVVSGWHCDASVIEFQIDDRRRVSVPYGSERKDTESVCGDWDNGFSFLLNYSGMGDGTHLITVYADGVLFGSAPFQVTTLGEEFVRGLQKKTTLADWPESGTTTVLGWDEAKQNFALESVYHYPSCMATADCGAMEYCDQEIGACGGSGLCEPMPEFCNSNFDPVCGCDGQTYSNACNAAFSGVSVQDFGACP